MAEYGICWLKKRRRCVRSCSRLYRCHLPALDVAINTGMRLSEQFSLTWDSVDLHRREITLDETKNGNSRQFPLIQCAWKRSSLLP